MILRLAQTILLLLAFVLSPILIPLYLFFKGENHGDSGYETSASRAR